MNPMAKNLILWVVIALVLMSVFQQFGPKRKSAGPLDYSIFISDVKNGRIKEVTISGRTIEGLTQSQERFITYSP